MAAIDTDEAGQNTGGFLRSLFGPSKREIWNLLAQQTGGEFAAGGFLGRDKVVVHHGQWTLTLDTYAVSNGKTSTTYTRLRAPYVNPDGFRFTVYRAGLFTSLAETLGFTDLRTGDASFDQAFVLKGNNEAKVRLLFADAQIKQLLESQPQIRLSVTDDEGWFGSHFPQGVDELYFNVAGVIKDLNRLRALFDLFAEVLDRLCAIGSAYESNPGVTL